MSNDVYLYSSKKSGRPGRSGDKLLRGAAYRMPVCWLASVETAQLKRLDDSDPNDEEESELVYFELSAKRALTLFESRRQVLSFMIANIEEWAPSWVSFLTQLKEKTVKIDLSEFVLMTADVESELLNALRVFDEAKRERMDAFLGTTSLPEVYDPQSNRVVDLKTGKTRGDLTDEVMFGYSIS